MCWAVVCAWRFVFCRFIAYDVAYDTTYDSLNRGFGGVVTCGNHQNQHQLHTMWTYMGEEASSHSCPPFCLVLTV